MFAKYETVLVSWRNVCFPVMTRFTYKLNLVSGRDLYSVNMMWFTYKRFYFQGGTYVFQI